MELSLCMIVKNEADVLERAVENARVFADEIVVVDTGSTDGTKAIAKIGRASCRERVYPLV